MVGLMKNPSLSRDSPPVCTVAPSCFPDWIYDRIRYIQLISAVETNIQTGPTYVIMGLINLRPLIRLRVEWVTNRDCIDLLSEFCQELIVNLGMNENFRAGTTNLPLIEA